jgi:hypothetical protein
MRSCGKHTNWRLRDVFMWSRQRAWNWLMAQVRPRGAPLKFRPWKFAFLLYSTDVEIASHVSLLALSASCILNSWCTKHQRQHVGSPCLLYLCRVLRLGYLSVETWRSRQVVMSCPSLFPHKQISSVTRGRKVLHHLLYTHLTKCSRKINLAEIPLLLVIQKKAPKITITCGKDYGTW